MTLNRIRKIAGRSVELSPECQWRQRQLAILVFFRCLVFVVFMVGVVGRTGDFNSRSAAFLNYYNTAAPNTNQTGSGPHRIGRTGFWAAEGRFFTNYLVNGSNYMSAAL